MKNLSRCVRVALVAFGAMGSVATLNACYSTSFAPSAGPKAAKSLACDAKQITTEKLVTAGNCIKAVGCGKTDVLSLGDNDQWDSLRERATFEMSCTASEVEVTILDSSTFGVAGCGKKMVYKWNYRIGFVANSSS